ncbi:coenzyme F420-0:L-glutamate ligase [archaeon]|nr:coenzyme F420-0:L-glutamate ligase [archaeon]
MTAMQSIGLDNLPLVEEGDDLALIIYGALCEKGIALEDTDIIAVSEKIVSKAEGRLVKLDEIEPSDKAIELGEKSGKTPEDVELILRESKEILHVGEFIVVETHHGFVCASAGIDHSNVPEGYAKLLPEDPDASASKLRGSLEKKSGKHLGVLIVDSHGRPFRRGAIGVAIGASGIKTLWDRRGDEDIFGRALKVTRVAIGDMLASAASLLMGEAAERVPVVIIKGVDFSGDGAGKDLLREKGEDVFR